MSCFPQLLNVCMDGDLAVVSHVIESISSKYTVCTHFLIKLSIVSILSFSHLIFVSCFSPLFFQVLCIWKEAWRRRGSSLVDCFSTARYLKKFTTQLLFGSWSLPLCECVLWTLLQTPVIWTSCGRATFSCFDLREI